MKLLTKMLIKILLLSSLFFGIAYATNTNTTSSYYFHVCHTLGSGGGNVNCTAGSPSVGYYNFTVVNVSAYNITNPRWTISPLEDSYSNAYPYSYCSIPPYKCRNSTTQWDDAFLNSGVYGRYYSEWSWLKFSSNSSVTGINWCDSAHMCLYKYSDTGIGASGYDFRLYYSHNQTWQEQNLSWDDQPDWIDAYVDKQNITDTDDVWICWDVTEGYCESVEDNATYMIRPKIEEFDTGSRFENFTVGGTGVASWDLYVNSSASSTNYKSANYMYVGNDSSNGELRSYWRVSPNIVYFPGSTIDNATVYLNIPAPCTSDLEVPIVVCYNTSSTDDMTWDTKVHCSDELAQINMTASGNLAGITSDEFVDEIQKLTLTGQYLTSNMTIGMYAINGVKEGYTNRDITEDAYVYEATPTTYRGEVDPLNLYVRDYTGYDVETYMKIDMTGWDVYPDNASLYIHVGDDASNVNITVNYMDITGTYAGDIWDENGTTWDTRISGTDNLLGTIVEPAIGWHNVNITDAVIEEMGENQIITLHLTATGTNATALQFNSSECDSATPYVKTYNDDVIGCFNTDDNSGTVSLEIGYTYTTKNKIAQFRSYNYTADTSLRPYLVANVSWGLNFSSATGNSTEGYTYTPNAQTDDQWIRKVCVDSDAGGPMDLYLNITDIVNSTGDSLTTLPSCVKSFYHWSNATNTLGRTEANITGNTAGRVANNVQNGTCAYIWENITFLNCDPGDYWDFNFTWHGCTDSGGC